MAAFKSGSRIAAYLSIDGETCTDDLLRAARRRGIRLYVPVVMDIRRRRLQFHPLTGKTRRGAFGIAIPHRGGRPLAARWFDLIVVPVVGVDAGGARLGMGGGFYDRALRFRRERCCWKGPKLVGLGFASQRTDAVFADLWDVRLDALATESGLHHFSQGME